MLDINTPKGQISLEQEREAHAIISKKWNVSVIETPKKSIATGDGFLVRNGEIIAFFETKCRYDMSYEELLNRGSWLVTLKKIEKCKAVSRLLQVPFLGFLYLLPKDNPTEKVLLFWKITNEDGEYAFNFDVQEQPTQRTINGGETIRKNAYFSINQMKVV